MVGGVRRRTAALAGLVGLVTSVALGACGSADAGGSTQVTLTVLAASSLTDVLAEAGSRYEADNPDVGVSFTFESSSAAVAQVAAGAPADLLFTADAATMARAERAADVGAVAAVATNRPVVAAPSDNPAGVTGLEDLARPELVVVLCDPAAPCGSAAEDLLADGGVTASPDSLEPNVRAVSGRLRLAEADVGIVYATDVQAAGGALSVVYDPRTVRTEVQGAVVSDSRHRSQAQDFLSWLAGSGTEWLFHSYGFGTP